MSEKNEKYPEKSDECPINWNTYIEECEQQVFLAREVKRLMRINDAFEFRSQLAYAFGYGDATGGLDFDGEFCIEDIHIDQDDDEKWTAMRREDEPKSDNDDEL